MPNMDGLTATSKIMEESSALASGEEGAQEPQQVTDDTTTTNSSTPYDDTNNNRPDNDNSDKDKENLPSRRHSIAVPPQGKAGGGGGGAKPFSPRTFNSPQVIAVTANVYVKDKEACMKVGMCDFIGKPIKLPLLKAALEKCVANKDQQEKE